MEKNLFPTTKWISVLDKMPKRNQNVLMYTPFCKHKIYSGYFNGLQWKSTENVIYANITYWAEVIVENLPQFDPEELKASEKNINEQYSVAKKIAVDFENWIYSPDCEFEYLSNNQYYYDGNYYTVDEMFDYFEENVLTL